jgi:hypothetical protein
MANTLLTINMILREATRLWENTNAFLMSINRQYDDQFAQTGAKIGETLRIRLPNQYTVRTGSAASPQDTSEVSTTLTVATQKGVDVSFSSRDRTMSLDDYSQRVLKPMIAYLAADVALDIMGGTEGGISNIVANQDGSNNILTPTSQTYLNAGALLDMNSAPMGDRKVINSPVTRARVVNSLTGLLNPSRKISTQYMTGMIDEALGFDWMQDQTVLAHTTGSASTAAVAGAGQTGLTLTVSAISGTLAKGDIITIAGVNAVNRLTRQDTGELRQFVVTDDVANGATSIPIYPAIVPPVGGQPTQYQTVTASPANAAAVNPALSLAASTTYRKNFVFCPDAVTMATADLEMPTRGVQEAARETYDSISMRMVTAYNVSTDQWITRLDILYGYLWVRPEWAVVVADTM